MSAQLIKKKLSQITNTYKSNYREMFQKNNCPVVNSMASEKRAVSHSDKKNAAF